MSKLTVGSLFAGIGGFDLGLERTGGFEVVWQCEIDPYCQRVLAKHWPRVKRYGDIRELADVERVDVLCGGFPCQDISNAGKRAGIDGERSGLWSEYVRVIRLVRPRYVIVENVAVLLGRGMGRVLGDLSESGYDAEWDCFPAGAIGAPFMRDRVYVLGVKPNRSDVSAIRNGTRFGQTPITSREYGPFLSQSRSVTAYRRWREQPARDWWHVQNESAIRRVAHGVPARVDRLKGLGNAVVPQIVEWIGNRILEHERIAA